MSTPSSLTTGGIVNTPSPPGEAPWHPPKGGIPLVGLADSPTNRGGKPVDALKSGPPSPIEASVYPPSPPPPPPPPAATVSDLIDERAVREYLQPCGWPSGLQSALIANLNKTPVRYFLLDDSGSMNSNDGKRIVGSGPTSR
jgi:hypothetical protein